MDRTEIAPLVRDRLGLASDDNRVNNTTIYNSINAALRRMANDFDWPWLITSETFTLNSGDSSHTKPADFQRTLWISVPGDNIEIRNTQRRALIRWSSVRGYPRYFSTEGSVITFAPTSNRSLEVLHTYVRNENQLANDTDEPLCPDDSIDVVILYAAIYQAIKMRDTTMAGSLMNELKEIKTNIKEGTAARPALSIRARHSWGWW